MLEYDPSVGGKGVDPSLNGLSQLPLWPVVAEIRHRLSMQSGVEADPYLWANHRDIQESGLHAYYESIGQGYVPTMLADPTLNADGNSFRRQPFWVSSLQVGTTTGAMRQHILQVNSSVTCQKVDVNEFPRNCSGDMPLVSHLSRQEDNMSTEVFICVPGDYGKSPWTKSRNAETITEELWLNKKFDGKLASEDPDINSALHCTAQTTRGYFELGNVFSNEQSQPLVSEWPSPEEERNFSDVEPSKVREVFTSE
jgi:hypothetical protein